MQNKEKNSKTHCTAVTLCVYCTPTSSCSGCSIRSSVADQAGQSAHSICSCLFPDAATSRAANSTAAAPAAAGTSHCTPAAAAAAELSPMLQKYCGQHSRASTEQRIRACQGDVDAAAATEAASHHVLHLVDANST